MKWKEIHIHSTSEGVELLSVLLQELGSKGIWIEECDEGVVVKSYLAELEDIDSYLQLLQKKLVLLKANKEIPLGSLGVKIDEVDEGSWADEWKKYYEPSQITDRFTVQPIWKEYSPKIDEEVIKLDPGMAFGTGTHPTTVLAVRLIEKYLVPGKSLLDVGCGSGILSVVSAKLGAREVLGLDIDPVAIHKTKENVAYNKVQDVVEAKKGDLVNGVAKSYDYVIANILAEVIIILADDLPRVINQGGIFICSGIIEGKEQDVLRALEGFSVLEKITKGSWIALALKRC